ncbi:hypothetical protein ACQKP8_27150 [Photobacterium alginatilyticum]|uniref:hypothetical protein n=1 Tax=Photobacterium alginatilyticum TaxID=1775171 RepID=UPI0040681D6D
MTLRKPKYPLKSQLPEVTNHNHLPAGAIELARIQDSVHPTLFYLFVKNADHLTIVTPRYLHLKNGTTRYFCVQTDFPMGFLPWLAHALSEFQKTAAEGGLHSGAMASTDQNVDGEMLCIQRTMGSKGHNEPGYTFLNCTRCKRNTFIENDYRPQEINFSEQFIFNGGLLELIQELADKYLCGEI